MVTDAEKNPQAVVAAKTYRHTFVQSAKLGECCVPYSPILFEMKR